VAAEEHQDIGDRPHRFSAAGSESDAATLLDELTRQRQQGHVRTARSLARAAAWRPKLGERDATDIIHAWGSRGPGPAIASCPRSRAPGRDEY
jgi:hypothetical protein